MNTVKFLNCTTLKQGEYLYLDSKGALFRDGGGNRIERAIAAFCEGRNYNLIDALQKTDNQLSRAFLVSNVTKRFNPP